MHDYRRTKGFKQCVQSQRRWSCNLIEKIRNTNRNINKRIEGEMLLVNLQLSDFSKFGAIGDKGKGR